MEVLHQIDEVYRRAAAVLYDDAFGHKFSLAIPSKTKRLNLLETCLNLNFCFGVMDKGELVGIAGVQTLDGSLTNGITLEALFDKLGLFAGSWAALVLSLYERELTDNQLLMDGIAVKASRRGQGIGSALLAAIQSFAKVKGFHRIRLDVIDTNGHAQRLYEKKGFKAVKSQSFPYLKWLLGFGGVTTMEHICQFDSPQ